jgi:hypothetical protein
MTLFVAAQLADLLTGLNLPAGAERNPVAAALLAAWPLACLAKFGLIVLVAEAAKRKPSLNLLTFGAMAGAVGTYSNLVAL